MIRTVIVDDEQRSRKFLFNLLTRYCKDIEIVGQAEDISGGVRVVRDTLPDLLFLDIQLREGTSFEILNQLADMDFFVIFTTAYDEYAIKAFRFNAIDYLLKPIDLSELKTSVARVRERWKNDRGHQTPALQNLLAFNAHDPSITVTSEDSIDFLRVFEIIRLESSGGYTTFFMKDGRKIMASKHLKIYDDILREYGFFRSHQSHLVNMQFVIRMDKQDATLQLKDGSSVPLSRRKKDQFLQLRK